MPTHCRGRNLHKEEKSLCVHATHAVYGVVGSHHPGKPRGWMDFFSTEVWEATHEPNHRQTVDQCPSCTGNNRDLNHPPLPWCTSVHHVSLSALDLASDHKKRS